MCANQASGIGIERRKAMKTGMHSEVNETLFLWFEQVRFKGMPLSDALLQDQDVKFHKISTRKAKNLLQVKDGSTDGEKRYGLLQLTISGESLSENKATLSDFK